MRNLALSVILLFISCPVFLTAQGVQPHDILITELMIDPSPVVGMPNFEWIELYNRSDQTIDLLGYRFSSGSTRYTLPTYELSPGAYVMICDDSDIDVLKTFGNAIQIRTFPSLTNGGDAATLEHPDGSLIHEVIYKRFWYGDIEKDDGGYSLEMINPNDPCLAASNWMASMSPTGATPATENSIWEPSTALAGVTALFAAATSSTMVEVQFDRIPNTSISEMDFAIAPFTAILDIIPNEEDARLLSLVLADELNFGENYTLIINDTVTDCIGLSANREQVLEFVLPESITPGDMVINEVLFNPIGSESDYVEIVNVSDKYVDVNQLMIANLDSDGTGSAREIDLSYVMAPMDYLVFTEDTAALFSRYPSADQSRCLEVDLPSFNNTDGNVTIFIEENGARVAIDAMNYDEEMHTPFIDIPEGVALERVDVDQSSSDRSNWQSGAASSGYGSPTLPNSQRIMVGSGLGEIVYLENKTFYPHGTANERLCILFDTGRSDFIATIDVYDSAGRYVHQLASNQLIGRSDQYFWDGLDKNGVLMNAGVYIIVVELVTADGNLVTKKLPCVLSRSL